MRLSYKPFLGKPVRASPRHFAAPRRRGELAVFGLVGARYIGPYTFGGARYIGPYGMLLSFERERRRDVQANTGRHGGRQNNAPDIGSLRAGGFRAQHGLNH